MERLSPDAAHRKRVLHAIRQGPTKQRSWKWHIRCRNGRVKTTSWSNMSAMLPVPGWSAWALGIEQDMVPRRRKASASGVDKRIDALGAACKTPRRACARRSQAAEVLGPSQRQIEQILDHTPAAIVVKDLKGRYILVNKRAAWLWHKSKEELVGKTDYDLFPKAEADARRASDQIAAAAPTPVDTEETVTLDGAPYGYSTTKFALRDADGTPRAVCVIARDVTRSRHADEQLRLLSAAVAQSSEGIAIVDLDGNLLFVNEAFARMHGYTADELQGRNLAIFHTPEQMPAVEAANRQIRETGSFAGEIWHVRRDGTVFPTAMHNSLLRDPAGRPIGMIGTVRDITEAKEAERRLQESERRYRDLVENANSAILRLDADGRILFANNFAQRLFGYREEELLGRSILGTIVPERETSGRDLRRLIADIRARPEAYETHENESITRDGRRLWIAWTHRAIRDAEGAVREILCIGNDATERKRMEEALRYRAQFEKIIAAASNEFINLPADRFDEGIQRILGAVGKFCGADRSYVFLRSDDGRTVSNTHEWCRNGMEPHKALLQNLPVNSFPWMKAQLESFGAVHVRRLADLPPDAAAERRLFERLGLRSCVCVPLAFAGSAIGFLGFTSIRAERAWDEDTVALLRMAGEIFVSAWQRKKAEEARRASEENYRRLFEYHPAACFTYDRDGIIRSWNREAERLYGYRADEVIGRSITETIASPGPDAQATAEVVARVFRGEAVSGVEWRDVGADGEPRWVLTNTFPIQDETGTVLLGVSANLDITARKRAEEALRSIVEGTASSTGADFFRSLVRHLAAALKVRYAFVGELQGDAADRVRTLAVWEGDHFGDNVEYPLAGTPCENVAGQTIRHYSGRVQELFPRDPLLATMGVETYVGVPLSDAAGRPIGLLSVMHDRPMSEVPEARSILTIFAARAGAELERKRASEALEESEARFRSLTENSLTGVYVFREQRFLYVNPAFARIFGYPRERILRDFSPLDLIHPDDRPLVAERIRQRMEGELDAVHYTFRGLREDGATIFCEAIGRRIDYGGQPAVIGTLLDITQRRRDEEALRDNEARTRAILDTAADAIVTADERGTIESFNPAAARMFGWSPEEIIGQNLAVLMPEPYASRHNDYMANYLRTGTAKIIGLGREIVARRRDGTVFPIELSVGEVHIGDRRLFTGIMRDITERKRAEDALRAERNLVSAILDSAGVLVIALDTQGRIIRFNRACEQLTGYRFEEVRGRPFWEVVLPPEEIEPVRRVFADLCAGQFPNQHDNEWVARDGPRRLISWSNTGILDARGEVEYIVGTGIDITDRERAERALRESEERHRTILDQMQEAVIFADAHDIIRHINACACEILNTTREQTVGRDILSVHPEAVRPTVAEVVRKLREHGGEPVVTVRRTFGDREMILRFSAVRGPAGEYWGIIANFVDITEQVQIQQRLAEARRRESVGTLAGGIAHDFNNLMATVLGCASHLKARRRPDHPDYESLTQIEQAAETAGRLAHQLLVYAKGGRIRPKLVDFREVIARAVNVFRPSLPPGIRFELSVADDLAPVECDTTQVEQVIVNLCRNAVDAMPHGGRLTVRATNEVLTAPLREVVPPLPAGEYVCLTVEDTGSGMDPETAERVFDPFFTTKPNGYGLGLAAAYGTITSHGGAIALTTRRGEGTTFRVWLPRARHQWGAERQDKQAL